MVLLIPLLSFQSLLLAAVAVVVSNSTTDAPNITMLDTTALDIATDSVLFLRMYLDGVKPNESLAIARVFDWLVGVLLSIGCLLEWYKCLSYYK